MVGDDWPGDLPLRWATWYHPEWDQTPDAYVTADLVAWGRSRRLARGDDPARGVRVYLGVQHNDPARWGRDGAPRTVYFGSLLLGTRTLWLHTFPAMPETLAALRGEYEQLVRFLATKNE
jgi:hypothetical protein